MSGNRSSSSRHCYDLDLAGAGGYDPKAVPEEPTPVHLEMTVTQLHGIDEIGQSFEMEVVSFTNYNLKFQCYLFFLSCSFPENKQLFCLFFLDWKKKKKRLIKKFGNKQQLAAI